MGQTDEYIAPEEYEMPKKCEVCNSEDIIIRIFYDKKIARYACMNCSQSRSIPKIKNRKKRTNTSLNNWRNQIIKLHPFCQICGSKKKLEVHHIIPVSHRRDLAYTYTNGITLCKECHRAVHNKGETDE